MSKMEMASKTTRDGRPVTTGIIRYLRPRAEFLDRDALRHGDDSRLTTIYAHDNLGGITFAIEIDHDREQLLVGYSVCTENFDKERGRSIALEMLEKAPHRCVRVTYNQKLGLVNSVAFALAKELHDAVDSEDFRWLVSDGLELASTVERLRFRNLVNAIDDVLSAGDRDKFSKALKKTMIQGEARDARFTQAGRDVGAELKQFYDKETAK